MTAERLAAAINGTTARYMAGFMSRATWRTHTRALWARAAQLKLTAAVRPLVTQASPYYGS